jgi:hypothetical protein
LTGPGAFWYTDGGAQLLASTAITGTAALDVAQPALSATGTNTQPPVTGTAALSVTQPALAGTGTFTPLAITGTAALTVTPPVFSATGTGPSSAPPVVGGRPHRKSTVNRYPPKRARVHDLGLTVNDLYTGEGSAKVKAPTVSGRGFVEMPGDPEEDTRTVVKMALEDEDLVLAYTMAETWLN